MVGCGHVGLPLAAAFNKAGLKVLGVEKDRKICDRVMYGVSPIREPGLDEAMRGITMHTHFGPQDSADAYVLCVSGAADLERATHQVAGQADDGSLVIVRSTVAVGTTRELVEPILRAAGSYDLAYCPERTVEGDALRELNSLPQIVGADNPSSIHTVGAGERAVELFRALTTEFHECGIEEAEMAKLLANAWRATTFAFANEVATLCDLRGVSAQNAINAANHYYPRSAIPRPGPVGGPCLTKDTALILEGKNHVFSVIRAANTVNHPANFADAISREMSRRGFEEHAKVAVLGTAFKGMPDTSDTRNSPGLEIAKLLGHWHDVRTVDPVACADFESINGHTYDVIVVTTDRYWDGPALAKCLRPNGFIYDCCWAMPTNMPNVIRWGG